METEEEEDEDEVMALKAQEEEALMLVDQRIQVGLMRALEDEDQQIEVALMQALKDEEDKARLEEPEEGGQAPAASQGQAPAASWGRAPAASQGQAPAASRGQAPAAMRGHGHSHGHPHVASASRMPAPLHALPEVFVFLEDREFATLRVACGPRSALLDELVRRREVRAFDREAIYGWWWRAISRPSCRWTLPIVITFPTPSSSGSLSRPIPSEALIDTESDTEEQDPTSSDEALEEGDTIIQRRIRLIRFNRDRAIEFQNRLNRLIAALGACLITVSDAEEFLYQLLNAEHRAGQQ